MIWSLTQALFRRILARAVLSPGERWHASLGVGVLLLLQGTLLFILIGTAPANGWWSVPTLLIASEWVVSALALAWIGRTGRWRGGLTVVILYTAVYVGLLNVLVGATEPGLIASVSSLIMASTLVLGHRWAWPMFAAFTGLYAALGWHSVLAGEATVPEATASFVGLSLSQAIAVGMIWFAERAREEAFRDAQERVAAEQAAEAASKLAASKSAFLATMSHEIRTPMNGVLNMQRLLAETTLTAEQRKLLGAAMGSSEALLHVLNDILDYSKIEAGQFDLEDKPFDLRAVLSESTALFQVAARDAGVMLRASVAPGVPALVCGDPARLRQVLNNLVSNAVKFTSAGHIEVRALVHEEETLLIEVEDTGAGIPPASLPRLFAPFTQADGSTTRRFGGTGLGLAISHQLCAVMGGELSATSALSEGSTFRLRLPLRAAPAPAPAAPRAASLAPMRVLIAEDNAINRLVLERLLEQLGVGYETVPDGRAAVARVQSSSFDAVLMDLHMPELDGLGATREIRRLPSAVSTIPIIAVTASALASDRLACLEAGMSAHIAKPVESSVLEDALRGCRLGAP